MKNFIISISKIFIIMLTVTMIMMPDLPQAAIQPGTGVYPPVWSPVWVAEGTAGMWQGFYISDTENKIRYDLVEAGGGNWKVARDTGVSIWEGNTNVMVPTGKTDVGYTFNAIEAGKVEFTMAFKIEFPNSTNVEIAVYRNDFNDRIFPVDSNNILAKYNEPYNINFTVDLMKGEKILFRFHSPAETAVNNQIRFTAMQAVYKSINTGSGDTSSLAGSGSTSSDSPVTALFDDVKINAATSTITLTKRLTIQELGESFILNDDHTIEILSSDDSVVEDMEQIVNDDIKIRVYKSRSEIIAEYKIVSPKIQPVAEAPDNTWIYIAIPAGLLLIAIIIILAIYITRRKNGANNDKIV